MSTVHGGEDCRVRRTTYKTRSLSKRCFVCPHNLLFLPNHLVHFPNRNHVSLHRTKHVSHRVRRQGWSLLEPRRRQQSRRNQSVDEVWSLRIVWWISPVANTIARSGTPRTMIPPLTGPSSTSESEIPARKSTTSSTAPPERT